ncbi:MAG: CoA-binding protein [bacterium]
MHRLFHPESIAIVGASTKENKFGGTSFLIRFQDAGYTGRLYPINPQADTIRGLQAYPDLKALPEVPDLAIVCVAAPFVPAVLQTCGEIGLTRVHILTSGFRELGTPEGDALEAEVKRLADQFGLLIVGPNCMGPYCPASGLTAWGAIPGKPGPIGIISQSGGITQRLTEYLFSLGIGVEKAVSMGNATVLNANDFLQDMAEDPKIRVIAMYLENAGDGRVFFSRVREIGRRKPIVILKGGVFAAGARTIVSHTGSMAGSLQIWEAFSRQTGAIRVRSMEEWADTTIALSLLPAPSGNGVFLATGGGGNSVINSDIFQHEGLDVPELSPESMQQLRQRIPVIGSIAGNPLDSFEIFFNPRHMADITQIVASDPAIAMLVIDRLIQRKAFHIMDTTDLTEKTIEILQPVSRLKPTVVTVESDGGDLELGQKGITMRRRFCESGIPAYPTTERAARALAHLTAYHAYKRDHPL